MRGELGCKIKEIRITHREEMCICDENGDYLHIVGDNDIVKLLENALDNYKKYLENKGTLINNNDFYIRGSFGDEIDVPLTIQLEGD